MRNINVQNLKVNPRQFFVVWLTLFQPFIKLRNQELKVLASLLYYRYTIQQQVKNKAILDELLFNTQTRKKIKRDLDLENYSFNNILTSLRKKGMIDKQTINPKIIPILDEDADNFKLVYNIDIKKED